MTTALKKVYSSIDSTPWTPKSDSSCCFWISAQGTAYANNAAVTTLTDMSSSNLTVTAGGTGGGPTFKTNIVNGYPGILFNGTNHYMQAASLVTTLNMAWLVVGQNVGGSIGIFMEQGPNINSASGFQMYAGFGQSYFMSNSGTGSYANPGSSGFWFNTGASRKASGVYINTATASSTVSWAANGPQWNTRLGTGTQYGSNLTQSGTVVTTSLSARTVTATLNIMARNAASVFANGYIHEIAIFSGGTYNLAWAQQLDNFVWQKWGI